MRWMGTVFHGILLLFSFDYSHADNPPERISHNQWIILADDSTEPLSSLPLPTRQSLVLWVYQQSLQSQPSQDWDHVVPSRVKSLFDHALEEYLDTPVLLEEASTNGDFPLLKYSLRHLAIHPEVNGDLAFIDRRLKPSRLDLSPLSQSELDFVNELLFLLDLEGLLDWLESQLSTPDLRGGENLPLFLGYREQIYERLIVVLGFVDVFFAGSKNLSRQWEELPLDEVQHRAEVLVRALFGRSTGQRRIETLQRAFKHVNLFDSERLAALALKFDVKTQVTKILKNRPALQVRSRAYYWGVGSALGVLASVSVFLGFGPLVDGPLPDSLAFWSMFGGIVEGVALTGAEEFYQEKRTYRAEGLSFARRLVTRVFSSWKKDRSYLQYKLIAACRPLLETKQE